METDSPIAILTTHRHGVSCLPELPNRLTGKMFERYTEQARRAIFFARYEASASHASTIEPKHMLLGALRERSTELERVFPPGAIESITGHLRSATPNVSVTSSQDLPVSNNGKLALSYAAEEADGFGHRAIDTEHLVLGLMRADDAIYRLLDEHGINRDLILHTVVRGPVSNPITREDLHSLIDTLPEQSFESVRHALTHMQVWPPQRPPEPPQIKEMRERMRSRLTSNLGELKGRGVGGGGGGSYSLSPSGTVKDARYSSGRRDDDGAAITETAIIQDGHQISTVERILLNPRDKILNYKIEVAGPGEQRGNLEIAFKVE